MKANKIPMKNLTPVCGKKYPRRKVFKNRCVARSHTALESLHIKNLAIKRIIRFTQPHYMGRPIFKEQLQKLKLCFQTL